MTLKITKPTGQKLVIQKPTGQKLKITPANLLVDDADALDYLAAVETADGQALETGVRLAVNAFVKGCKADGIWNAIKASCILAGARTLSGALVPLKGTAPTNFNFVSGDYDRKTGLVGNGSTKYLNSNRNNNADPQDNQHVGAYLSAVGTGMVIGIAEDGTPNGMTTLSVTAFRSRNASNFTWSPEAGLIGVSRASSASFTSRANKSNSSNTQGSQSPTNANLQPFAFGNVAKTYGTSRLAFYSIGESLDLGALDTRVTALINAFGTAIA